MSVGYGPKHLMETLDVTVSHIMRATLFCKTTRQTQESIASLTPNIMLNMIFFFFKLLSVNIIFNVNLQQNLPFVSIYGVVVNLPYSFWNIKTCIFSVHRTLLLQRHTWAECYHPFSVTSFYVGVRVYPITCWVNPSCQLRLIY